MLKLWKREDFAKLYAWEWQSQPRKAPRLGLKPKVLEQLPNICSSPLNIQLGVGLQLRQPNWPFHWVLHCMQIWSIHSTCPHTHYGQNNCCLVSVHRSNLWMHRTTALHQWRQPQIPPAPFHLPSTISSAVVLGTDWLQTHNRHSDNPFNFSGCKTHSLKTSVKIFGLCRCVLARPRPCPLIGSVIAHSTLLLELLPLFGIPSLCLRQS